MNKNDAIKELRNLTTGQAKVLKGITVSGGGRLNSLATGLGPEAGAIAYSLEKKGFIEQIGRIGQYKKYAPTAEWQHTWDSFRDEIQPLLERNARIEDDGDPEMKVKVTVDENPQVNPEETYESWKKKDNE